MFVGIYEKGTRDGWVFRSIVGASWVYSGPPPPSLPSLPAAASSAVAVPPSPHVPPPRAPSIPAQLKTKLG